MGRKKIRGGREKDRFKKHAFRPEDGGDASEIQPGSPVPSIPAPSPSLVSLKRFPLGGKSSRGSNAGKKPVTIKERLWLKAYLDEGSPTFFQIAGAAKAAGYAAKTNSGLHQCGSKCLRKMRPYIRQWLDEIGASEEKILQGISEGLGCKETRFFAHQGEVKTEKEVIPWAVREKYLRLAAEVRGMLKSNSPTTAPIQVVINNNFPVTPESMVGVAMEGRDFGELGRRSDDKE
ncbi:MAG: hypothetical protein C4576_23300 [Desulfobacteraceae bacterium]|nr:MAG: hypothetical protein C4576_23300 [Desulfobacteraceae bacterium]